MSNHKKHVREKASVSFNNKTQHVAVGLRPDQTLQLDLRRSLDKKSDKKSVAFASVASHL